MILTEGLYGQLKLNEFLKMARTIKLCKLSHLNIKTLLPLSVAIFDAFKVNFDHFLTHIGRYLSHNLNNVGF